jgi:uncharacterized metal-binding protein YceD (DUF177 family)
MRRHRPQPDARLPWSAPVAVREVPETGRHVTLVADEATRAAVAQAIGLRALPRLEASFDVSRQGREGLHVAGRVSATVGQTCVVTLEPVDNELDEAIDLAFVPEPEVAEQDDDADRGAGKGIRVAADDAPEPLIGGVVDLGVIATEVLTLGLDPYPRKPGAEFANPVADDDSPHPFAVLAALKKGEGGS